MNPEGIPITTVIVTHERPELLMRALLSIRDCKKPAGYQGVIIVENGPRKMAHKLVEQASIGCPIRYFYLQEPGKSKALNFALTQIPDGLVYFNDDDVRLDESALMAVAEAAKNIPGKFFLGGPVGMDYELVPPLWLKRQLMFGDGWELPVSMVTRVSEACFFGANWVAAVDDLRRIGGFAVRFGPTEVAKGEETKAQRLLLAAGVEGYYVPDARLWHYISIHECMPKFVLQEKYRGGVTGGIFQEYSVVIRCICVIQDVLFIAGHSFLWGCNVIVGDKASAFTELCEIYHLCGDIAGRMLAGWRSP